MNKNFTEIYILFFNFKMRQGWPFYISLLKIIADYIETFFIHF